MEIKSNILSSTVQKLYQLSKRTNSSTTFKNLFESKNVDQFVNKVNRLVDTLDCTDYEFGKPLDECKNKVKGDLFELFTILWLNSFGGDRSLLIQNLKWSTRDMEGIDFFGMNKEGNPMTVQSKFVGSIETVFEGDGRLETFFGKSLEYVQASSKVPSTVLVTTAVRIGERYRRMERSNSLLLIDRKKLNKFCKNNIGFWNYCLEITNKIFR